MTSLKIFKAKFFFFVRLIHQKKIQADVFLQYSIIHKRYEKSILQNSHNNAHLKVTHYGFRWTHVVDLWNFYVDDQKIENIQE